MKTEHAPVLWLANSRVQAHDLDGQLSIARELFPPGTAARVRAFHQQIPDYDLTPLHSLTQLSSMLGVGGVWTKDESQRFTLNSFKLLGGSYAMFCVVKSLLDVDSDEFGFADMMSPQVRRRLGDLTFATATDGNHGCGVAWTASALRFRSVIYVHKGTSQARIDAISDHGAEVRVVDGTYDDAVRRANSDAKQYGWQVISDTSWDGYEDVPKWVMQGYLTMFDEAQEQLAANGVAKPTHVFIQAGVGSLAAAAAAFYRQRKGGCGPKITIVEPKAAACLLHSMATGDGEARTFPGQLDTMMAGLACGDPSPLAWKVLRDCADVLLACPDYVAARGMRMYASPLRGDPAIVSGESGAVTLGALSYIATHPELSDLRGALGLSQDSQVLLINTEGDTDPGYFRRVVWDGAKPVPSLYHRGDESGAYLADQRD